MKNDEYWLSRIESVFDNNYKQKKIKDLYKRAYRNIEDEVKALYDEFMELGELTTTKLYHYDRFQSLLANIKKEHGNIRETLTENVTNTLSKAYKDTFGETEKLLGEDSPWGVQNEKMLESVLKTKWAGSNYSKRIWKNTDKLARRIESDIAMAVTQGIDKNVLVKQIQKDFNVGFHAADRLVRTELMRAINRGQIDTYKSKGVKQLEWTAANDDVTCGICKDYNGRIFDIDDSPVILHPNCRCTVLPVLDEDDGFDKEWQKWLEERNLAEVDGDIIDKATGKSAVLELKDSVKTVDKSVESGIIELERSGVDMFIDKFTPCLENAKTGEILQTSFSVATKEELKNLKNWNFDWTHSDLDGAEVYKLTIDGAKEIQGLIALTKYERDKAMYVNIVESAPHNLGVNKRYNGVGGHLYAIAVLKSLECGYDGFVFMDAKNIELVEHYKKTLGAVWLGRPHQYRMFIDEESARRLIDIYTLKEE